MPFDIIKREKYTFWVDAQNQYMVFTVRADVVMDAPDIIESRKIIAERYPGIKFYVLSLGTEFFTLTKEARAVAATKDHAGNALAVAVFTKNISLMLVIKMFININKPYAPTEVFNDLDDAKLWLQEKMGRPLPDGTPDRLEN